MDTTRASALRCARMVPRPTSAASGAVALFVWGINSPTATTVCLLVVQQEWPDRPDCELVSAILQRGARRCVPLGYPRLVPSGRRRSGNRPRGTARRARSISSRDVGPCVGGGRRGGRRRDAPARGVGVRRHGDGHRDRGRRARPRPRRCCHERRGSSSNPTSCRRSRVRLRRRGGVAADEAKGREKKEAVVVLHGAGWRIQARRAVMGTRRRALTARGGDGL